MRTTGTVKQSSVKNLVNLAADSSLAGGTFWILYKSTGSGSIWGAYDVSFRMGAAPRRAADLHYRIT